MKFDFDWRVLRRPVYAMGVSLVLVHLTLALGAPFLSPFDPTELLGGRAQAPDAEFWLGTDVLGRDYLSRLLHGGRMALLVAFSGVLLSVLVGSFLGVLCAYLRGLLDQVVMRLVDVKLALPGILFIALFVTGFGESVPVLVVLIGLVYMPGVIRIVRAAALSEVSRDYVRAAQLRGERTVTILWREVYPNLLDIVLVEFAIRMSSAVLLMSSMSFLGLGISPPTPDWGLMVSEGVGQMSFAPWLVLAPSLFISTLVLGLNFGAEALASALGVDASRGNLG
ncbi:ABC transporter permease [Comamonas testosteroni]|uniref:ABC transporter permease n=1 Tax=Comamonas testosteroni TaxID=285 RepID=UPI0023AA70E9|nr:ABC transporter permease [Comamonas testosteroni]WEE79801.1 ABC transporter permease [Comamonas testosteroni]